MPEDIQPLDPLVAIAALGDELRAAQKGVKDAFTRIREVKSRIAVAKKALRGLNVRKPATAKTKPPTRKEPA